MVDSYIIAIDFGTAYSGYAFSITSTEEEADPYLKLWGEEFGLETTKTPTCILFDRHGEFLKFGYEAKKAYFRMRGDEAKNNLFFDCFKMFLYGNKLKTDLKIQAASGKSMQALKVFTAALRYLKEDAMKTIARTTEGMEFIPSDFTWVLTVPAIWDPSAKQFMRKAATEAGIVTKGSEDKLIIALEPEAASVWCKKLPADGFIAENRGKCTLDQKPETKYIVVDCGGGTIDITVHEVLSGGDLKELHKASGNDLGGQSVDRKFKEFLREIFCDGVWNDFEMSYPSEVQRILYDFTLFKKKDDDVEISCPFSLGTLAERKKTMNEFFESVKDASWDDGSINISKDKVRSFYDESLEGITKSITEIFKKKIQIDYILLVGGYAESQILIDHIKNKFGKECTILCPFRPQEAIVKGAVQFGRNPAVVTSRKSAFTYGVRVARPFNESKHKAEKKKTNKDGVWCSDIFFKLVEIDENVGWNETRKHTFAPSSSDGTISSCAFFHTEKENPKYVDEEGVDMFGSFDVESPDTTRGLDREIKLEIHFGFTEMIATATDIDSGSNESIKLDFMTK